MSQRSFLVPDIGEGLAEVEIVEWLVDVGTAVDEHQPLVSVETDKSVIEIPSPYRGIVVERNGSAGDRLAVGAVLVVMDVSGAIVDGDRAAPVEPVVPAALARPAATAPIATVPIAATANAVRHRASPAVRRRARELGIDLATVTATGRGGVIVAADLDAAAAVGNAAVPGTDVPGVAPLPPVAPDRGVVRVALRGLRRTIAANMERVAAVPHITSHREIEVSRLLRWRADVNAGRRTGLPALHITPFLALCVIAALRSVPELNATFDPVAGELLVPGGIHLGVATATDDGLLVPIVHDADLRSLDDLGVEIDRLAEAARKRSLTPGELGGGTFTISNYGARSGWYGTPLLHLPEIGIAGFGRVAERPWVTDGQLVVAPVLPLSVSVDHRIIDGDTSGRFSEVLASYLNDPLLIVSRAARWS